MSLRRLGIISGVITIVLLASVVGLFAWLSASINLGERVPPPTPSASRVPDVIGVLTKWDWVECAPGKFWLDTGEVLEFSPFSGSTTCGETRYDGTPLLSEHGLRLRGQPGQPIAEPELVIYGEDQLGAFYAAASLTPDVECPWVMEGLAWDEGDLLHLSSGLILQKEWDFTIVQVYQGDRICLNREGEVVSVERWTGP